MKKTSATFLFQGSRGLVAGHALVAKLTKDLDTLGTILRERGLDGESYGVEIDVPAGVEVTVVLDVES